MGNVKAKLVSLSIDNPEDTNQISLIGRALNAPIRIEILRALNKKPMLLSEIAKEFDLPISSAAFHMKALEDANLINTDFSTKRKGTLKWYSYAISKKLIINLRKEAESKNTLSTYNTILGIGDYVDAEFPQLCGIATEKELIMENGPHQVFIQQRKDAQLIWIKPCGYITYALANEYAVQGALSEINLSFEICSEAMGFNADYPSDITFWINDVEVYTWTCPGDFGDRYGKFTPNWWYPESTKYGLLTNLTVKEKGVYFNEQLVNKNVGINNLNLANGNRTLIKIGVKKDAKHKGGFNLFGEKFGDFNQAIVFTARYKQK